MHDLTDDDRARLGHAANELDELASHHGFQARIDSTHRLAAHLRKLAERSSGDQQRLEQIAYGLETGFFHDPSAGVSNFALASADLLRGLGLGAAALGRIRAAAQSDADLAKLPALRDFLLRETGGSSSRGEAFERLRLHARFNREQPEADRQSINDVAQELIDAAPDESSPQVEAECERFFEQDVRDRAAFLAALSDSTDNQQED
jgi:hypothetical protein